MLQYQVRQSVFHLPVFNNFVAHNLISHFTYMLAGAGANGTTC